jgi:hypothetical protein
MFPNRYFANYFADRYWPPVGSGAAPPVVAAVQVGGHFLPEFIREKDRPPRPVTRQEVRKSVNKALREMRGEVERIETETGVVLPAEISPAMRDRLAAMLATDAPDYLTPLEAARQLVIELIAEQNKRDEEESMFVIMALGA